MSDVSAAVLTLGEPTTGRALASLRAQTLPVERVVVVDGIRPFHRALNTAASRVTTPFFLQVDADMVLDPPCTEVLRKAITTGVAIAVGPLRDPLMDTITGVKVFRRECFSAVQLRDTVAPTVDFYTRLEQQGWLTRWVLGHGRRRTQPHTLGEHRPDYTADYVFGTYYVFGSRYVHRDPGVLLWRFRQLRRSPHLMAPVARLAMGHGMLGAETRDVGKPRPTTADSLFLRRLVVSSEDPTFSAGRIRPLMALPTKPLLGVFRELGAYLRATSHSGLRACLRVLGEIDHPRSFLAEVALGRGALATSRAAAADTSLTEFERLLERRRI
jgi:hypothetical protein